MVLVFRFLIVRIVFRERGLAVGLGAGVKFRVFLAHATDILVVSLIVYSNWEAIEWNPCA